MSDRIALALALAFVHFAGSVKFPLVMDGESPPAFICTQACCTICVSAASRLGSSLAAYSHRVTRLGTPSQAICILGEVGNLIWSNATVYHVNSANGSGSVGETACTSI